MKPYIIFIFILSNACDNKGFHKSSESLNKNQIDTTNRPSSDNKSDYFKFKIMAGTLGKEIPQDIIFKHTNIREDSVNGHCVQERKDFDIIKLYAKYYKSQCYLIFDKDGNQSDILIFTTQDMLNNKGGRYKSLDNSEIFNGKNCLLVNIFDPIYHNRMIAKSEMKNIKITKYCIVNKKWVKQE